MKTRFQELTYRLYLKACYGKRGWHRRFYRPSVRVVRGASGIYFEEADLSIRAEPIEAHNGLCAGRANVLLSGPSAKTVADPRRLLEHALVCVNGSPAIFGKELPGFFLYHVNDTGYIRNHLEDFLNYAGKAEFTVIDFRAVYLLLSRGVGSIPGTRLVVFDNWAWPHANQVGEIPEIAAQPRLGEARLSTDPSIGLANAGTVAYTAAQILWHWGFEDIFFYGLDMNSKGRAYKEAKAAPQRLDKVYSRIIEPAFQLLTQTVDPEKTRFYNCSPESRLPEHIMPKVEIERSFES